MDYGWEGPQIGHKLKSEVWGNELESVLAVELSIEKSSF